MKAKSNYSARIGRNAVASLAGALAIVIMVNYLSHRHYLRMDWTGSKIYTLSQKTENIVRSVTKPVKIYVLWSKEDSMFAPLMEILKGYQNLSPQISIELLDPDLNADKFKLISEKYGKVRVNDLGQKGIEAGVFVINDNNVRFIPSEDFQEYSDDLFDKNDGNPISRFKIEQQLTSALLLVTSKEKQTICFTQGHGEWMFEGEKKDSLRHIKKGLELDGYKAMGFNITNEGKVPSLCNAVVVTGPTHAFLSSEASILSSYLDGGGRLLLLLDPLFKNNNFLATGLEELTAQRGILLQNTFVLETDPRRLISTTPVTFIADKFYAHDSVKPLAVTGPLPVVFSIVRSLKSKETDNVIVDDLISSSPMSWGEVDLASLHNGDMTPTQGPLDHKGPLTIGMVAVIHNSDLKKAGRLMVIGDSDFLSEELFMNAGLYNRDLWNSIIGWMTTRPTLISIAPKNPEQVHLNLSEDNFKKIWMILISEILFIILAGIFVIYKRRK
jgi:hypothetical protein